MRIGLMAGASDATGGGLDDVLGFIKRAEEGGFDSVWLANIFGLDAISVLTMAGRETSRIELGTAVTPTYPRHPTALAQQAATAGVACEGRFTLGIGLSHKMVIENMLGLSYARTAPHMNEYLQVLGPLLRGEQAEFSGEEFNVNLALSVPGAQPVPILVGALGPKMLKEAGTYADGTTTWMTGPVTLRDHIGPAIRGAAEAAGRPEPRVVAGLPIVVTDDTESAKAKIGEDLQIYGILPSYRAMLDREGAAGPADVALVGNESQVRDQIAALRDAGVTDFNGAIVPVADDSVERTLSLMKEELG